MWVGYDVENRRQICEELPIQWVSQMKVLGIIFENNLQNMSRTNLDRKLDEIKAVINTWKRRHLTIYGKICVIKTLLLPKLTHLFSALPNPPPEFMQALNTIFFNFVWNGKRDKISRKSLVQPVESGGAGMVDIQLYLKSLKVSWVRRQLQSGNQWARLFECKISKGECIWDRNSRSLRRFGASIQFNRFWCDVNEAVLISKCLTGIIINVKLHHAACGTLTTVNSDGNILSFEEAKLQYGMTGVQFEYDCLVSSLPRTWRVVQKTKLYGPLIDPSLAFIISETYGVKHIYLKMIDQLMGEHMHKWESKWNQTFTNIAWKDVYKNNMQATSSMYYRSVQYKIITRIHVTQRVLYRIGATESNSCNRCRGTEDNIEHKFWDCRCVQTFWEAIKNWLVTNQILETGLNLNAQTVLLGLGASTLVNHVIVVAKTIIAKSLFKPEGSYQPAPGRL